MTRTVLVVSRREATLYEYARRYFADRPDVAVVADRRHLADRRHQHLPVSEERRRARRRVHLVDGAQLGSRGFAVVTVRT
jgi:hypothetical protein